MNEQPLKEVGEGGRAEKDVEEKDVASPQKAGYEDRSIDPQVLKAARTLLEVQQRAKLVSFVPYDANQMRFFTSPKRRIAVLGPNRHGKTTMGAARCGFHFSGWYPDWFPKHRRLSGPTKGRIIISEYKEHGRVLVDKIKEWFPKTSIKKFYKNPQGYVVGVEGTNGSHISILTHEQETKSHEGWDGHYAWFDEPCPRDKFIANLRGLVDRNGECFFTLTPISEAWLSDEIHEENPDLWDVIELELYANPYINRKALDDFFSSVDPMELAARKHGKFIHLEGAIYQAFNQNRNIIAKQSIPDHWPRYMVCDPHDRRPFAMGWYAIDPTNRVWVYDEYPRGTMFHKINSTTLKIDDFATAIRNQEGPNPAVRRIIDRRYGMRRAVQTGRTIQENFTDFGLYFEPSYDDTMGGIEAGHIAVKKLLGRPDEETKLLVMDHCINHRYGFTHYTYDPKTGKPREEGKDFMDLIRYLAKDDPNYDLWSQKAPQPNQNLGISGYGE